eukprot:scaffold3559_cov284-Chaetoceros_neogracile.AAC.25
MACFFFSSIDQSVSILQRTVCYSGAPTGAYIHPLTFSKIYYYPIGPVSHIISMTLHYIVHQTVYDTYNRQVNRATRSYELRPSNQQPSDKRFQPPIMK